MYFRQALPELPGCSSARSVHNALCLPGLLHCHHYLKLLFAFDDFIFALKVARLNLT